MKILAAHTSTRIVVFVSIIIEQVINLITINIVASVHDPYITCLAEVLLFDLLKVQIAEQVVMSAGLHRLIYISKCWFPCCEDHVLSDQAVESPGRRDLKVVTLIDPMVQVLPLYTHKRAILIAAELAISSGCDLLILR